MLRLWPKEVQAGLFPQHCWLRVGSSPARDCVSEAADGGAMLLQLERMLDDPINLVPKGADVVLTVSDAFAAIVCLPWQPKLRGAEELRRYAEICFERQGREVDSTWLLHAEYRQFGANSIAYALPAAWVDSIKLLLQERGLHLRRVLPASAAMYFGHRPREKGRRLSLLVEARRATLLNYSGAALESVDVEPVTTMPEDSLRRLLRRATGPVNEIAVWTSAEALNEALQGVLKEELPDVRRFDLARERIHRA